MKIRSKIKSTPGLLGVAGLTLAGFVAACDQAEPTSSLVQRGEDGSCVIATMAEARAATHDNMEAKSKDGMNACNPCAADACNPCAAACNPCGGCNPCAGSAEPQEASGDELNAAYDCLKGEMKASYGMSGENGASDYQDGETFNTQPYPSATHGGRFVNNYANGTAASYGKFEEAGIMPIGSILAKDSLTIDAYGKAAAGPLFLMEKMDAGFDSENGDWKYSMIMPDGTTWGVTNGKNSKGMQFCIDCHIAVEDYDYLFFLPDEFRRE